MSETVPFDKDQFVKKYSEMPISTLLDIVSNIYRLNLPQDKEDLIEKLYNLVNPQEKYLLTYSADNNATEQLFIGTKEKVITFMINHTFDEIDNLSLDVPEYKDVTIDEVSKYYNESFTITEPQIDKFGIHWNNKMIDRYTADLVDMDRPEYYVIYRIKDIEDTSSLKK